jgi:hypothetical protein
MALKPRVANSPLIDSEGYCTGTISDIEVGENHRGDETFVFMIEVQGKLKPITMRITTGTKISQEQTYHHGGKQPEYYAITTLLIRTGLIKESELASMTTDQIEAIDIEQLKGKKIKALAEKSAKSRGLVNLKIDTIEIVK